MGVVRNGKTGPHHQLILYSNVFKDNDPKNKLKKRGLMMSEEIEHQLSEINYTLGMINANLISISNSLSDLSNSIHDDGEGNSNFYKVRMALERMNQHLEDMSIE